MIPTPNPSRRLRCLELAANFTKDAAHAVALAEAFEQFVLGRRETVVTPLIEAVELQADLTALGLDCSGPAPVLADATIAAIRRQTAALQGALQIIDRCLKGSATRPSCAPDQEGPGNCPVGADC